MIYYVDDPFRPGNTQQRYYKAVADSIKSMKQFYESWESRGVLITLPPVLEPLKSPALPKLLITTERMEGLIQHRKPLYVISEAYFNVMQWLLKVEFYEHFGRSEPTKEGLKDVQSKLRMRVVRLLADGEWVDTNGSEWSDSPQKLINAMIEKIDLGRNSGLKFSRDQPEEAIERTMAYRKVKSREKEQAERFKKIEVAGKRATPTGMPEDFDSLPPWKQKIVREGLKF